MGCEERRADLVGYLYGELTGRDRDLLVRHIDACAECETELAEMAAASAAIQSVRSETEPWAQAARTMSPARNGLLATLRNWWGAGVAMPRWALGGGLAVTTALLLVAAQLDIERSGRGVTIAWGRGGAVPQQAALPAASTPGIGASSDPALIAQVAGMLEASEKRQTAATAQLVDAIGTRYARDLEESRRHDLQLVDYWIGNLSGKTQLEFTRTNQQLDDMAQLILASQGGEATWPGSRGVPGTREGRLEPGATGAILPAAQPKESE